MDSFTRFLEVIIKYLNNEKYLVKVQKKADAVIA